MKSAAATLTLALLLGATGNAENRAAESTRQDAVRRKPPLALTPTEYNNTIADLLGFPRDGERWPPQPPLADTLSPRRAASRGVFLPPPPPPVWPWQFPSEPGAGGFEGIARGQNPSSYQVEELHLAAMHFASFALLSPTFFACGEWAALPRAEREGCAWTSLERFAERAWRRPLDPAERKRIDAFWRANLAAGPLEGAVALTAAGILQAPAFHSRIERGETAGRGPTPWELATRLSYFLWDSMPDDALFAAAAAGALSSQAGVEAQARRMLEDPKARAAVVHFHNQWLGTDDVLRIAPSRRAFGPLFGIEPELETARDDDVEWPTMTSLARKEWSAPLAPLHPHRRRLIVLDGLSLATAELDAGGNRHDRGWIHAWTGNNADFSERDTRSTSASLDQLVAAHIARPDRLPSLELSVDAALEAGRPIAYNVGGIRLPAENTPLRAWERVFGPASSGDVVGARRRTTLDFAYREYRALASGFDAVDRARIESHFGLVDRLGHRLEGLATLDCDAPPRPAAAFEQYDRRFDAFADIIAAAFGCDITRVVSLSLGEMPTADFGADHISDKVHKGIAHYIYDDPAKHAAMSDYVRHHARQVARLVETLEAIPDAGGGSVMDNTLMVWGSELGDGWHGYSRYNPVLIGGSWAFRTGRYLYRPHETPVQMRVPSQVAPGGRTRLAGVPHQRLLASVARAMGLDVNRVGLRQVRGQRGDFVDVSGPLDGLTA